MYSIFVNPKQNPWANPNGNNNNGNGAAQRILAPLLETLISPDLFREEYPGLSRPQPNDADIGAREAIIVLNPTKYTVKEDEDDEMRQDQVSLNDSIEDDQEELKVNKSKKKKNKDKKQKNTKKVVEEA